MIEIVPYKDCWPSEFAEVGAGLRAALGDRALAIHHIGSTSVPGLGAKDIIDVQVTVADLDREILASLGVAGYPRSRPDVDHCPPGMTLSKEELQKFICGSIGRKAHIHIRVSGRFNQRYPLLCRDYLRSHRSAADAYCEIKLQLAHYFPENVDAYYDIKDPVFDVLMTGARDWAEVTGWAAPASDA